jgi:RimJ/RimL family protein N-acetyltransferase
MRIELRDPRWAADNWFKCEEGVDPVATYGDESRTWPNGVHPADYYWAVVEDQIPEYLGQPGDIGDVAGGISMGLLEEPVEIGMAWATRGDNCHVWTHGFTLFPEYRRQRKGSGYEVGKAVTAALFEDPNVTTLVTMVYSTNPAAVRYNGLRPDGTFEGRPGRRFIGVIEDAGGEGVDLYLFQLTRAEWKNRT